MIDINVVWLNYNEGSPERGYWSYGWLEQTLINPPYGPWPCDPTFYQGLKISDVPKGEGAIVVVPAEYNAPHVEKLKADLATLPWYVLILASDERGLFPVEELMVRPQDTLWVMTPHFEKHVYPPGTNFLGVNCPQDARERLAQFKYHGLDRDHDCSFSGQITHQRRVEMVDALEPQGYYINKTAGFTQGLDRDDYYELMASTITTPAPSGPVTLDSFRAYEALESGGIPILDLTCPLEQDGHMYWNAVLGEGHPLPTVRSWYEAQTCVEDNAFNWPLSGNLVFSWWQMHKRELRYRILDGVPGMRQGDITILIPTSPIPSHPSTKILDETIGTVRFHFPDADILIMCDGVRPEQEHRRDDYERYVQEVCWKANFEWRNVYPIVFGGHEHQANMTRAALDYVRTPLILFVEHDTPIVTDEPINWSQIIPMMKDINEIDVLRLHSEALIHPEHEYLMDGPVVHSYGVPMRMTHQWSQRPHVAKTGYYRRLLREHFPLACRTMIEDRMHSVAQVEPLAHVIAVYHPGQTSGKCNPNIKRSYHTDGRADDEKFPMVYQ